MIAVTFALPEESCDFRKAMRVPEGVTGRMPVPLRRAARNVHVLHTGVGLAAAERTMREFLAVERPAAVISSGYAGALDPMLKVADLVVATNFSSPELVKLCQEIGPIRDRIYFGELSSQATAIESVLDKAALGNASNALAVDMETAAIAAACRASGVPFLSVRAISDSAIEPLPVPFNVWFDLARQRPRALNLVLHLGMHPGKIAPFVKFVRGLAPARLAFTGFLIELLNSKAWRDAVEDTAAFSDVP